MAHVKFGDNGSASRIDEDGMDVDSLLGKAARSPPQPAPQIASDGSTSPSPSSGTTAAESSNPPSPTYKLELPPDFPSAPRRSLPVYSTPAAAPPSLSKASNTTRGSKPLALNTSRSVSNSTSSLGGGPPSSRRGFVDLNDQPVLSPASLPAYGTPIDPSFLDRKQGSTGSLHGSFPGSPYQPYPPPPQTSAGYVYGSKRDLWENSMVGTKTETFFGKESLRASLPSAPPPRMTAILTASPPSSSSDIKPPAAQPRRSRNDIFNTVHTVTKPAIKMTNEELKELKQSPLTTIQPLRNEGDAIKVVSEPCPEGGDELFSTGTKLMRSPSPTRKLADFYTRSVNSERFSFDRPSSGDASNSKSLRRGFVDLDDSGVPLSRAAPSSLSQNGASNSSGSRKLSPSDSPFGPPHKRLSAPSMKSSLHYADDDNMAMDDEPRHSVPSNPHARSKRKKKKPVGLTVVTNPANEFDNIHLSFLPLRKNFLGEGRYAQVYLGQYTTTAPSIPPAAVSASAVPGAAADSAISSPSYPQSASTVPTSFLLDQTPATDRAVSPSAAIGAPVAAPTTAEFQACAVKRLHATPDCQAIGLAELFILRRIGQHPHIVHLIGAKDENDVEAVGVRERIKAIATGSSSSGSPKSGSHGIRAEKLHQMLEPSPRLLILLQYEPGGTMWEYIDASREDGGIGQDLWLKWSRQLASAVEYIHSLGIVHHDIKPHNCLLNEFNDVKLSDFGNACFVPGFSPSPFADAAAERSASPVPLSPAAWRYINPSDTNHSFHSNQTNFLSLPPSPLPRSTSTPPSTRLTDLQSLAAPDPSSIPARNASSSSSSSSSSPSPSSTSTTPSPTTSSLVDGLGRGTQAYTAPELFDTPPTTYSFPIDVYSLGVTMHVAATAADPFCQSRTAVQMLMGIRRGYWASGLQVEGASADDGVAFPGGEMLDRELAGVMSKCVERDPAARPTAREVVVALMTLAVKGQK
ncbi:hypothetical protein DFJ73DRAFT_234951 [Zopfochytrium polystomum]|nr:hypothetical protein DFJ73DRAFT_234951 [Zopfochytrium polystomum]